MRDLPIPDILLFVDECGNTGPNMLDTTQPVFVHAGVLVLAEHREALTAIATDLRGDHLPASQELHSGILNTARGRAAVCDLLRAINNVGAIPVVCMVERAYAIAGFIVETLFDKAWNDHAPEAVQWSPNAKQDLAQLLLTRVSPEVLVDFAKAHRERHPAAVLEAARRMALELGRHGEDAVASGIEGAAPMLVEQYAVISATDAAASGVNTLNFSYFAQLLRMAELAARTKGRMNGEVVHDESPQGPAYRFAFDTLRAGANDEVVILDNDHVFVGKLNAFRSMREADSRNEPILQIADVIAGTYQRLARESRKTRNRSSELDAWLLFAFAAMPQFFSVTGSHEFLRALFAGPVAAFAAQIPR